MIMTNWGNAVVDGTSSSYFTSNLASFWIKIAIQWLSFLIFMSSQIVYKCCPDRFDF